MSEFKYACPVCGQHISCDSSQAGTVMECPTCFQKITVPQAPAGDDPKFIITGTQVGERPAPNIPEYRAAAPEKKSPLVAVLVLLVLACAAGAAVFVCRGRLFKSSVAVAPTNEVASGTVGQPKTAKRPEPALGAPPASDTNWMLNLETAVIPDSRAAGRIHGKDFICERAYVENGALTLRVGTRGQIYLGITINFGVAQPEALAGQSFNVNTNTGKAARVTFRYVGDGQKVVRENFDGGYALRLKFNPQSGNRLTGNIYFCAPDETKS